MLGVDPGTVTGVFLARYEGANLSHIGYELPPQEVFAWVTDVLHETAASAIPLHIFIERYIITARTAKLTQQTDALEVIGRVKAACEYSEYQKYGKVAGIKTVSKSGINKLASDDTLKTFGWHTTKSNHVNDAARQACFGLFTLNTVIWSELAKGKKS